MSDCPTGNYPQRLCDVENAVDQINQNLGHPPLQVTFTGAAPSSFNQETQRLVLNIPVIPPAGVPEVVVTADDASRGALAPQKLSQLLIQTSDPENGNYSIWAATGLGPGQWSLKSGRYNRAALPTGTPNLYVFDWQQTDNWRDVRIGPANYLFTGLQDGLRIRVYIVDVTAEGWPAPTWPAGIIWSNGGVPFTDGPNTITEYNFDCIDGQVYGRATIP